MNCPRCNTTTEEIKNGEIGVDVCFRGCGGIWFDWMELKKMDESHEAEPAFLEKLGNAGTNKVDLEKQIYCPKCIDQPMVRRFWSTKKEVEIDECPKCGGFWLDSGELLQIYNLFETEEERKEAAMKQFGEVFNVELVKMMADSNAKQKKKLQFARMFRFILPSYYFPHVVAGGAYSTDDN